MLRLMCVIGCLALAACTAAPQPEHTAKAGRLPVILISLDGFRPDYLHKGQTPNLDLLGEQGLLADGMHSSFPSITFPNHYTLVTGLRPDEHGVVGNLMDDPTITGDTHFSLSKHEAVTDARWWNEAEPAWVTAKKQGLRTATMFWPGSEAPIHDVRPDDWRRFDVQVPATDRVDQVLDWLERPAARRPDFVTLYFENADEAGHEFGPDIRRVAPALGTIDNAIGRLMLGLRDAHLDANIIVVSDHGMAATSAARIIQLNSVVPTGSVHIVSDGAYAGINPRPGYESQLAQALSRPTPHMACWPKDQIPARFHFGRNPRVPAWLCLADIGWTISHDGIVPKIADGGTHGYDNMAPEMTATFIAHGPAFRPGTHIAAFDNVDVYPLVMHLLGAQPLPNDGTLAPFEAALVPQTGH